MRGIHSGNRRVAERFIESKLCRDFRIDIRRKRRKFVKNFL